MQGVSGSSPLVSTKIKRRTSVRLFIYPSPKGLVWHQFALRIVWNCGLPAHGITRQRVSLRPLRSWFHTFLWNDSIPPSADSTHRCTMIPYTAVPWFDTRYNDSKMKRNLLLEYSEKLAVDSVIIFISIIWFKINTEMKKRVSNSHQKRSTKGQQIQQRST